MLTKLRSVRWQAWLLLILTAALGVFSLVSITYKLLPPTATTNIVMPVGAIAIALLAYAFTHGQGDRVRHAGDKAILIGSVLAIWFVAYFATGLLVTYVHNALVSSVHGIALNIFAYGATAAAVEYTRHRIMLIAKRRNALWFGVLVVIAFALPQMTLGHVASATSLEDVVKLVVSDFIPALAASTLLTYLAIACGMPAQLTYRLGVVAMTILPPVIPKYDWYLIGVTSVLLTVIVYLVIDHTQQERHQRSRKQHTHRAFDAMWAITMLALILFMTGFFAYKPSAIMSNSMSPVFSRGAMVILQKNTPVMDINIGDIIQYESRGRVITHRVIDISQSQDGSGKRVFITKGDNNPSKDMPVNQEQVLGTVRAQVPHIGYPTVWLREITIGNESEQVNG